jgi:hypothetical protein
MNAEPARAHGMERPAEPADTWWQSLAAYLDRNPEKPADAGSLLYRFLAAGEKDGPPFVGTLIERVRDSQQLRKLGEGDALQLIDRALAVDRTRQALPPVGGRPIHVGGLTVGKDGGCACTLAVALYHATGFEPLGGRVLLTFPSWWFAGWRGDERAYEKALAGACHFLRKDPREYFVVVGQLDGKDLHGKDRIDLAIDGQRPSFALAIALGVTAALCPGRLRETGDPFERLVLNGKPVYATGKVSEDGWITEIGELPTKVKAAEEQEGTVLFPRGNPGHPGKEHRALEHLVDAVSLLGRTIPNGRERIAEIVWFGVLGSLALCQLQELAQLATTEYGQKVTAGLLFMFAYVPFMAVRGGWVARHAGRAPGFRFFFPIALIAMTLRGAINFGPSWFTGVPTVDSHTGLVVQPPTGGAQLLVVTLQLGVLALYSVLVAGAMTVSAMGVSWGIRKWRRRKSA